LWNPIHVYAVGRFVQDRLCFWGRKSCDRCAVDLLIAATALANGLPSTPATPTTSPTSPTTTAARVELSLRTILLFDAVFAGMSREDEPDTRP